jgi:hypothetical protein
MSRRGRKKDDSWMFGLIIFVGVPLFLLMVHPLIFFFVFVPLVALVIIKILEWLKK